MSSHLNFVKMTFNGCAETDASIKSLSWKMYAENCCLYQSTEDQFSANMQRTSDAIHKRCKWWSYVRLVIRPVGAEAFSWKLSFCMYDCCKLCHNCTTWWRGSVVRTSVCSWRTFSHLRLIHRWCVTSLWVRRPLWVNQLGQLSLPSLWGR